MTDAGWKRQRRRGAILLAGLLAGMASAALVTQTAARGPVAARAA